MANINGLALFLTSTVLTVSVASACAKSVAVEDYVSTLSKLFQPVKAPSRHVGEPLTTDQVFQQRKGFFSTLFAKTAISKSCKIVHVAGTKGKGSTIEYISSSLINSGKRVGIFTSPHIHTARERAKINRSLISRASMVKYGKVVLELMKDRPWAVFFDLLLALSILYFDEKGVDFLVLETGIGGRYDSTNFADCPAACVITSISLDHQAMLGDTIEKIAYQKAGIIKPNSHVFTPATQKPSVMEVFRRECAALNATLHEVPADKSALLAIGAPCETSTSVQVENACLSLAVLQHLGVGGSWDGFFWPCRLERFSWKGSEVVLDGAHNGDSVHHFLRDLRSLYPHKQILLLFGAGQDKCLSDMLEEVFEGVDSLVMVRSKHFRSLSERELLQQVPADKLHLVACQRPMSLSALESGSIASWLDKVTDENASGSKVIAVCGSLFVAAEAREALFSRQPSLFSPSDWVRDQDPPIPM